MTLEAPLHEVSRVSSESCRFIDVEYWDKTAELAEKYLSKGREFIVQGELCMSSWEKDGKNFSKYYIRGKDLQFLSSAKKSDSGTEQSEESEDSVPF